MQDRADGAALDAELIIQFVDGSTGLVSLDQELHLLVIELTGELVHEADLDFQAFDQHLVVVRTL